jgi:nickel-dependent lactate racemase
MTEPTTTSPTSLFCSIGSETTALSDEEIRTHLSNFLSAMGEREDIMIVPPDYTRFHSQAGKITRMVCEYYNFIKSSDSSAETKTPPSISILPALGTHAPMTPSQIESMYGSALNEKEPSPFLVHDWRNDVVTIGHVPNEMVLEATRGFVDEPWPAQLNKVVWEKRNHDPAKQKHKSLVLSIGQVVPHEGKFALNFCMCKLLLSLTASNARIVLAFKSLAWPTSTRTSLLV